MKLRLLLVTPASPRHEVLGDTISALTRRGHDVSTASTDDACLAVLHESTPDVVLLRDDAGDPGRLERLVALAGRHAAHRVPVVLLVDARDDRHAMRALARGAEDVIALDSPDAESAIDRAIRAGVERHRWRQRSVESEPLADAHESRFLSHVSHELRSPLAAIYQFLTLVHDGLAGPTTDEQKEYLGTALASVARLESMIETLVDSASDPADERPPSRRAA